MRGLATAALVLGVAVAAFGQTANGSGANSRGAVNTAVVTHPDVLVEDISFPELREILLGDKKYWPSGRRYSVTLLVRAADAVERDLLLKKIYRMSEKSYAMYWVGKRNRTEATEAPREVHSTEEALKLVRTIEGAVTLINSDQVPEDVRVLKIDGHLPGDPDYPLK